MRRMLTMMLLLTVLALGATTTQATMCWEVGDPYEPDCSRGWGWERVRCKESYPVYDPYGGFWMLTVYNARYEETQECVPGKGEAPPHCWDTTPLPDTRSGFFLAGYHVQGCTIDEVYDMVLEPATPRRADEQEFEAVCRWTNGEWPNEYSDLWYDMPDATFNVGWVGWACTPGQFYRVRIEQVTSRGEELGRRAAQRR